MQYPSPYSFRALSRAITTGTPSELDRLFGSMADSKKAFTSFCLAINSGVAIKTETARFVIAYLLNNGIQIEHEKGALLKASIEAENIAIIDLLLQSGANPNVVADNGATPLEQAAQLGWNNDRFSRPQTLQSDGRAAAIIDLLLEHGADAARRGTICRAAGYRSLDVIVKLVDRGGGVDDRDKNERTPLFFCFDSLPVGRYFISQGADVNARDKDGNTPLMAAALSTRSDIKAIRFVLESGAEVNTQNRYGQTALGLAEKSVCRNAEITALLEKAAAGQ